jgi:xylulokinase
MTSLVLAHDLGTTGNKATLYDHEGVLVGSAFFPYSTEYAHPRWAEQDPEDWWLAVCSSTRRLMIETAVRQHDIACIVFSGQMMGCVPLDKNANPLSKAIIWADQRAVRQERWLAERLSHDEVYSITGHRLSASYSLCKILWMREHRPDVFRASHKFVHAKDAMVARLTGVFATDPSDASGMNLYDLERGCWSGRVLDAAGLDEARLPELRQSVEIVGTALPGAAAELGISTGTPVVMGGGDGACAAAGAGVVGEGAAYNYVGSSSWIALATPKPIYDPRHRTFTFGHVVPNMFMPTGTMQSAGASYQWARDNLPATASRRAARPGTTAYELMNAEAEESVPGCGGLIFLPYLMGERSPRWNPDARGAFVGLTVRHGRGEILRAVLEGVTMNLRVILDAFRAQGTDIQAMRLIGGGARGRLWNQIMADVYGMPVHRLTILEEATSMGAALIGGIGAGLYSDFSMIDAMNQVAEVISPNPEAQKVYDRIYSIFEAAYDSLEPLFGVLGDFA